MGRVEQFVTTEPAQSALVLVGLQNPLTKGLLVKPTTRLYGHILASQPSPLPHPLGLREAHVSRVITAIERCRDGPGPVSR